MASVSQNKQLGSQIEVSLVHMGDYLVLSEIFECKATFEGTSLR